MNVETSSLLKAERTHTNAPVMLPAASPGEQHFATDHLLPDLKRRTISSGFITIAGQAAKFFLTLGSTMILARLLTPHDFGLVAMVTTVVSLLRVFKEAGLSVATVQKERISPGVQSFLDQSRRELFGRFDSSRLGMGDCEVLPYSGTGADCAAAIADICHQWFDRPAPGFADAANAVQITDSY